MPSPEDIQYAIANTRVILAPRKSLETFGQTVIHYHLVTERMDTAHEVIVREGQIHAEKPQLITASYFETLMLEGFGEEASGYVDWLKAHFQDLAFLKYGFRFRKENTRTYTQHEPVEEVLGNVKNSVASSDNPLAAVIHGVDDAWEICLLKFATDFIRQSSPANFNDLKRGNKLHLVGGVPQGIRDEIDEDMAAVGRDAEKLKNLAQKLRQYGVFEDYEDRFYEVVRQVGR
ncbi:hypothetical protein QQ054_34115 [Oscillatoria amoena NRMC-F 0135]|nr:hypothetical protein [Oscillatoria laete-virens]MDL5051038.1 hypothetical protein [Oscillatoria amoena NRMC-F 0135]MDL5054487.1 hypothetical protein [Oscillatoria laete-virens NRMC-F 0139]